MSLWQRLVGDRPIVTRLVLAVAAAMTVVLAVAAGIVYWRVSFALDRQLDQDLNAYQEIVERAVRAGQPVVGASSFARRELPWHRAPLPTT